MTEWRMLARVAEGSIVGSFGGVWWCVPHFLGLKFSDFVDIRP